MNVAQARRVFLLTTLVVGLSFSYAENKTALSVADGLPKVAEVIGEESFVPVEVEKLKDAKVWFVDYEWHRQHGIDVPSEGIADEQFRKQILDAYAWQARGIEDHDGQYTGEKKKWYADYYGGFGMGTNHGSGRAAAMGLVQAKGTKTSLAKSNDPWHSNGAVQTIEAADEAIWSQVLDQEMKHGANKVVAVILTGTYGRMKDGNQVFPRALIIREMAVRPAHFQLNYWRLDPAADSKRVARTMKTFVSSLPMPEGFKPASEREALRAGVLELISREAKTQAEYYAKRMFFGSVSPSNVEITGRRLDLGDHTAQEGYSRIWRVQHAQNSPFGSSNDFKMIFNDMRESWAQTLPKHLKSSLPTRSEMDWHFDNQFENQKKVELVKLTGAPPHLVEKLQAEKGNSLLNVASLLFGNENSVTKLGSLLLRMTTSGNDVAQFADPNGWENKGTYDVNNMLTELAASGDSEVAIERVINKYMPANGSVNPVEVKRAYVAFKKSVLQAAQADGVSSSALNKYMSLTARAKNTTKTNLIRGHKRWRQLWDTTDQGIHGDPKIVENYIQEQVEKAVTSFKDVAPYHTVVIQKANKAEGTTLREVFDAKTGKFGTIVRVSTVNGNGRLNGMKMSAAEIAKTSLYTANGKSAAAVKTNGAVEFYFEGLRGLDLKDLSTRKTNVLPLPLEQKRPGSAAANSCRAIFKAN